MEIHTTGARYLGDDHYSILQAQWSEPPWFIFTAMIDDVAVNVQQCECATKAYANKSGRCRFSIIIDYRSIIITDNLYQPLSIWIFYVINTLFFKFYQTVK